MGGGSHDYAQFQARVDTAKSTGQSFFQHDAAVRSGRTAAKAHVKLDMTQPNRAGKIVLESRDLDDGDPKHKKSKPVAIGFDVTGTMQQVPKLLVEKFKTLMGAIVGKGFLEYPHLLFAAIGDARTDSAPFQCGKFETGNEMDEVLANIYLEGNGGGNNYESYDLFLYAMARYADCDCWNNRGEKGYLFLIGDELVYQNVKLQHVRRYIDPNAVLVAGESPETPVADLTQEIPVSVIIEELKKKWNLFWILPGQTINFNNEHNIDALKALVGAETFIKVPDPGNVTETICVAIGIGEGFDPTDTADAIKASGGDAGAIMDATTALAPFQAKSGALRARDAAVDGNLVPAGTTGGADRL